MTIVTDKTKQAEIPANYEHISQRQRLWRMFTKNRTAVVGLVLVIAILFTAIFADNWFITVFQADTPQPLLAPHDPVTQDTRNRVSAPDADHILGRDDFGRDVFSRIIYGTRISLIVGVFSVAFGGTVGTTLGIIAAYSRGWRENVIMRSVDVLMAFPSLLMGLIVLAVVGSGLFKMIIAIGIMLSPAFVRIAHSATLSVKEQEYVLAAQADGAKTPRILFGHILPNIMGELIVLASIWVANAIRIEASLSFIGLGVSPPTPAWGSMIRDGMNFLRIAPWMALFPGIAIVLAVLAFNLLGDGLRDVLDPQSYD